MDTVTLIINMLQGFQYCKFRNSQQQLAKVNAQPTPTGTLVLHTSTDGILTGCAVEMLSAVSKVWTTVDYQHPIMCALTSVSIRSVLFCTEQAIQWIQDNMKCEQIRLNGKCHITSLVLYSKRIFNLNMFLNYTLVNLSYMISDGAISTSDVVYPHVSYSEFIQDIIINIECLKLDTIVGTNLDILASLQATACDTLVLNNTAQKLITNYLIKSANLISKSMLKLQLMFSDMAKQLCDTLDGVPNIFKTCSLPTASSLLYRLQLEPDTLPILSPTFPRYKRNTSKWEYLVCMILTEVHRKYCKSSTMSFFSGTGIQYTGKRNTTYTSADFWCEICEKVIDVSGMYKVTHCVYHENKLLPPNKIVFGKTVQENYYRAHKCREDFKAENDNIREISVLNQCCLQSKDLEALSLHIKTVTENDNPYLLKFKTLRLQYDKDVLEPMNPQDAIPSPTVFCCDKYISAGSDETIIRYDLNFAYPSVFCDINFCLPKNEPTLLAHVDADHFIKSLITSKCPLPLGCVRVRILPPQVRSIDNQQIPPYFAMKYKDQAYFIRCKHCFKTKQLLSCNANCSDIKKSYYITATTTDLQFAVDVLDYKVLSVSQVLYYKQKKHYETFANCAKLFLSHKKGSDRFTSCLSKQAAITGLGRMSMSLSSPILKEEQSSTFLKFGAELAAGKISKFRFYSNKLFVSYHNNNTFYDVSTKSARVQVNALIFALAASRIKQKVYQDCLHLKQNGFVLCRVDTDSIVVLLPRKKITEVLKQLNKSNVNLQYKIETKNIKEVFNYSKRSYALVCSEENCEKIEVKCCGLQIPLDSRKKIKRENLIN